MTDTPAPTGASSLDDDAVERLLTGRGDPNDPLVTALVELRREAVTRTPQPSAELSRLLAGVDEVGRRRRRAGRVTLGVVIAGTATLTLSGVAAANDLLPGPAQGVVTQVVNDLTPFHIGRDRPAAPPARRPSPADPVVPSSPRGGAGGRPSGASSSSDDRSGGAQDTNRRRGGSGSGAGSDRRGGGAGGGASSGGSRSDGGSGSPGGSGNGGSGRGGSGAGDDRGSGDDGGSGSGGSGGDGGSGG